MEIVALVPSSLSHECIRLAEAKLLVFKAEYCGSNIDLLRSR